MQQMKLTDHKRYKQYSGSQYSGLKLRAKKRGQTVDEYLNAKLEKHLRYKKRQKQQNRDNRKKRAAANTLYVWEYKKTHPCKCGASHPACIDFHHRDPTQKKDGISDLVKRGASQRRLLEEINKCEIMCSNCHRIHHWWEEQKRISFSGGNETPTP